MSFIQLALYLTVYPCNIVDKDGNVDVHSEREITVNVSGAELLGVYSGNPISADVFGENKCHVFKGRALAVIRTAEAGKACITVSSRDLRDGTAEVIAK